MGEPISLNVLITNYKNQPCIELRTKYVEPKVMKYILSATLHNRPILILPQFTNKIKGLNSAIDKGIIYKEGSDYFFCLE